MIRLKQLREERHWSMAKAAEFLGKSYTTYVNHEKEYREPNSEDLIAYARAYGVSVDFLVGRTDYRTPRAEAGQKSDEDELVEELQMLRDLPERRALLHATKGLTADQVRQMADFLEGMKRQSGNDY